MFLSVAANPEFGDHKAPWSAGMDWNCFVVIDSNVDLFLEHIGHDGLGTYDARRAFVQALALCIDLAALRPRLHSKTAKARATFSRRSTCS
jgi:hypothetical protein